MKKLSIHKIIRNSIVLFFAAFSFSCQLFENDVNDFMEKYTETAGIEQHELSVQSYLDAYGHACINSKKDVEVMLYMRNPKRFDMIPSVDFSNLSPDIDRSEIQIVQTSSDSLKLTIPQSFLVATDEGKNITSTFTLYEPMSGRIFTGYDIPLYCNSIPPKVEVPTIINNGGQNFVIAFDMPSPEELSLRHKDITAIRINNSEYPVTIFEDGTFSFADSRFTREPESSFVFINDKDFTQTTNSVYFQSYDPFIQGDKSYTLGLKDSAGLIETVFTSTSISRLSRPSAVDIDGFTYANNANEMVSGSNTEPFALTLNPATTDHKGNAVADTTLNYTVYRGTSMVAAIFEEGSTNQPKTLNLAPGTYFIEAYSTKTNYEQSAVYRVTFRVVDNAIFVSENGSDITGDGTRELPFQTLNKAMADVDVRNMPNANVTIYLDGTIRGAANISATKTRSITLTKRTGGADVVIDAQSAGTALNITTTVPVILRNMTITGGSSVNGGAIKTASGTDLKLHSNVTITGNSASGDGGAIYISSGSNVTFCSGTVITGNTAAGNGGGVYNAGNLSISGLITINSNTNNSGDRSNVYLATGKKLTINGALSEGGTNSTIGISTQSSPSALVAVTITDGYGYNGGYNNNINPGNFFIGDAYAINIDDSTGEVGLYLDSGTFDDLLSTLNITFALDHFDFTVGTDTPFVITPTVTVMNGSTPVNIDYSDIQDKIVWTVKLKNGGVDVAGVASSTNSITIPSTVTVPDSYKLYVKAVYDGLYTFDREFDISGHN